MAFSMDMAAIQGQVFYWGNIFLLVLIAAAFGCVIFFGIKWFKDFKLYSKYKVVIWKTHKKTHTEVIKAATPEEKDMIKEVVDMEMPIICGYDKGAVIYDKKLKRHVFHLKKERAYLGYPEDANFVKDGTEGQLIVPAIPCNAGGNLVFVEWLSERKYALGQPFMFDGNVKVQCGAADVAEAIWAYDTNAAAFGQNNMMNTAAITFVVFAVLIVIMIAVVVQKFDVIKESMQLALEIAKHNQGTAVITGVGG